MNLIFKRIQLFTISILTASLCGCGTPMTPDFGEMSASYANTLEQYQINMLFQNILRAAESRPVSFLDMPSINGSGSITVSPYLSGLFTGGIIPYNASYLPIQGGLSTLSPGVSLSTGNTFNFTQSSLDNAVFWKGFLNELPIESVKYFEHNHIPKEVLLSLVIDEIVIIKSDGVTSTYINNPLRPDHAEFQKHLYRLIELGLGAYKVDTSQKIGPPIPFDQLKKKYGEQGLNNVKALQIELDHVGNSGEDLFQPVQVSSSYKICIKENKFENYVKQEYGEDIFCKKTLGQRSMNDGSQKKNQPQLIMRVRSPNNIFEYFGQVVRAQLKPTPYQVVLPPSENTFNPPNNESNQYALFVVTKDTPKSKPFSSVKALDGTQYTIPNENNGYSAVAIKILAQIMTLQKIPGSIPPSPAVLIK